MDIIKVIQETATWIEKVNNDYEFNLYRTPELSLTQRYCEIPDSRKADVVNNIVSKRSDLLKNTNVPLIPVEDLHQYGRIMIFDIDDTVVDGAPESVSAGYIDIEDAPPYDTWIATGGMLNEIGFYIEDNTIKDVVVVAWIPKDQYFYADLGVQVACVDNLWWAASDNINSDFEVLKPLFEKPAEIIEPVKHIKYSSKKQDKSKNFFQRLFSK